MPPVWHTGNCSGSERTRGLLSARIRCLEMDIERSLGSTFAGYRLEAVLGRGGMGIVYRATELANGRSVALKLLRAELVDPVFSARFSREAELGRRLNHPHIVPLLEAGQSEGVLYLTMAYIDGTDLCALLAEHGPLHPALAAAIVAQLAAALDAAAQLGLVHRDVKPANVLIESRDGDPHAYLADFGVSRDVNARSGLTATGMWVGSVDYAAPEQFQSQAVDARTDVYALGCLLYESLTGEVPFPAGRDEEKLIKHLVEPPPQPTARRPELPPALDAVVARAMAKVPAQRFPTAGALASEVQKLTGSAPARAIPRLQERVARAIDRDAPTAA